MTRTPGADGVDPGDPFGPGGPLASHLLSEQAVVLNARPVRDRAHVVALVTAIATIRGVQHVAVDRYDGTEVAMTIDLSRPTGLGEELRSTLDREIETCTLVDGRIELTLTGHALHGDAGERPAPWDAGRRPIGDPGFSVVAARAASDLMVAALHFSIDVSIFVFDQDLRYLAASGAIHERRRFRSDEVVGARAPDVLPPPTWEALSPGFRAALEGTTSTIEFTSAADPRGSYEETISPVNTDAKVLGGMLVLRDVTTRRHDAVLLAEITDVFDLTFAYSPVCQALVSPEGRWAKVNRALCVLLGRDEATLLSISSEDVTHPEDRGREAELLRAAAREEADHYELRKRFVHADGREIPVDVRVSRVRSRDGALRGFVTQVTAV
jgi:PAS domain S-box-containing protein